MTEAQEQARERAFQILGEHFNVVVVLTSADIDENGEESDVKEELNCKHTGGFSAAFGLICHARDDFGNKMLWGPKPEEEEQE